MFYTECDKQNESGGWSGDIATVSIVIFIYVASYHLLLLLQVINLSPLITYPGQYARCHLANDHCHLPSIQTVTLIS